VGKGGQCGEANRRETMRQQRLVDDADGAAVRAGQIVR
jgi:hypothetical protein